MPFFAQKHWIRLNRGFFSFNNCVKHTTVVLVYNIFGVMVSPTLSARPNTFKTTLLYTFRSHDKESSYMENVVQRRGWLDSIVFGLQLLVLSFSSYRVHGDITVQHQWIVRFSYICSSFMLLWWITLKSKKEIHFRLYHLCHRYVDKNWWWQST